MRIVCDSEGPEPGSQVWYPILVLLYQQVVNKVGLIKINQVLLYNVVTNMYQT